MNSSSFNFQIKHLSESSTYKVAMYAINSKGKSDQVWITAATLRKAEKYTDSNTTDSSLVFSSNSLDHIKILIFSLCAFLFIILVVIVTAITYMSRLCQRIKHGSRKSSAQVEGDDELSAQVEGTSYALENLGIQTVYTETNDAICNEYYSNLLAQYSPKANEDIQLLSLDLYKINKGPPDLIPTFYYDEGNSSDMLHINT